MTIDAMGCQTAIAEEIIRQEANYVLAVKQNQGNLYEAMLEYFTWAEGEPSEKKQLLTWQYEVRRRCTAV